VACERATCCEKHLTGQGCCDLENAEYEVKRYKHDSESSHFANKIILNDLNNLRQENILLKNQVGMLEEQVSMLQAMVPHD